MGNSNLQEKQDQFLTPIELHSETNKTIHRSEVKETDQTKDKTKDEDDHQQMHEKENMNTKNNEKNVKLRRRAKQKAISNIQKYTRLQKNNYDFLDNLCAKKGECWENKLHILTFFLEYFRIQDGRLKCLAVKFFILNVSTSDKNSNTLLYSLGMPETCLILSLN